MFNLKPNDPLDSLMSGAKTIVTERGRLLETIGKAETRLREAEAEVAGARERVTNEEFEAAQREGGLAIASKATQQALAEADLNAKSARLRLEGLRAGLNPIKERLEITWKALERYRDEFILDKVETASQEFDEVLKALIHAIFKARALAKLRPKWSGICAPFHPAVGLARIHAENPYTRIHCVRPPDFVWVAGQMIRREGSWRIDPEAAALYDAIDTVKGQVQQIGVLLGKVGLSIAEEEAQSEGDAPPEAMTEG